MSNKYLIIEQVKLNTFNDLWSVKYFDQSYDDAFTKLVALETLKSKDDNKVYYVVNQKHLWTKTTDVKIDNEIKKPDQETNQEDLPF
tara:strand:- start:672 stop:932 length:261 start_codon:yes stop_codon:yes gene_type:complete